MRADLSSKCLILYIIPLVLDIWMATLSVWCIHPSPSPHRTPWNLVVVTFSNCLLFNIIWKGLSILRVLRNIMYTHFVKFKVRPLAWSHSAICASPEFIACIASIVTMRSCYGSHKHTGNIAGMAIHLVYDW